MRCPKNMCTITTNKVVNEVTELTAGRKIGHGIWKPDSIYGNMHYLGVCII